MIFKASNLVKLVGVILSGIYLFVMGCGGATTAPAAEPVQKTETEQETVSQEEKGEILDFKVMVAREFEPIEKVEIKDPKGAWVGVVEAVGEPAIEVDNDGVSSITIPIGTRTPVTCVVYAESVDIGGTFGQMFEITSRNVDYQKISTKTVAVVGDAPMMAVYGLYTVEQNGQRAAGTLKMAMYAHPDHAINCFHDEVGYSESFLRVIKGLFSSFEVAEGQVDPNYAEVWTAHLSGIPVGFSSSSIFENEDGTWTSENKTTMIIPRSPKDLYISDQYTVTETDGKGRVTSKKEVSTEGGEISMNIDIEHLKKKEYTYKGEFKGKQIEGTFKTNEKQGLIDDTAIMVRVKKIFEKGKDKTFRLETYHPDMDPTKPMEVKYEVLGTKNPQSMIVQLGQLKMTGTADKNGDIEQMIIPMGTAELIMKRGYMGGEIPEYK